MKEIQISISRFISMIDERIKLASSIQTETGYIIVKERFQQIFKNFTKDDIVISKEEYLDLLEDRLSDYENIGFTKFINLSDKELEIEIKEIKEKIDYLKLL